MRGNFFILVGIIATIINYYLRRRTNFLIKAIIIIIACFFIPYGFHLKSQETVQIEVKAPEGDIIVKNEHKNFDDGADIFGIKWNKKYSLYTITIRNKSKNKSMRQFSLVLGFKKANILHKDLVLNNGAREVKQGKDISIDMYVKGPLDDKIEKPIVNKVFPINPANILNTVIDELYPEGSVTFRVILDNNDSPEVFYNGEYYYEVGKELKKVHFSGNLTKDKPYAKSQILKKIIK